MFASSHPWIESPSPELHVVTFPQRYSVDELTSYFDAVREHEAIFTRPNAWVFDASHLHAMSVDANKRKLIAEHDRSLSDKRAHSAGTAVVMKNQVQRGLLTAIFWISPPVYPWAAFVDRDDAVRWSENALERMKRASG